MRNHTQTAGQSRSRYVKTILTRVHVFPERGYGRGSVDVCLLVKRLHPRAVLPERARPGDAGLDLRAVEQRVLRPGQRADVGTGLAIALPPGFVGLVHPRSGLALRHGVTIANAPGTIDAGYRGEIRVILVNLGGVDWKCDEGNRIAQLLVAQVESPRIVEVSALPGSERGDSGFGSTGLR
jgi:dUTP pyrophosphatase